MTKHETIAAVSTAPGRSGIGVVRVSGTNLTKFAEILTGRALVARQAVLTAFRDAAGPKRVLHHHQSCTSAFGAFSDARPCSGHHWSGASSHKHYPNQGGHYVGGHGSSHKGGHYVNPRTGNHYTHHPNGVT